MIGGERTILDVEKQRILAAWGEKTAYSLIAAEKPLLGDPVPQALRTHLYGTGEPADSVWVAYGRCSGPASLFTSYLPLEDPPDVKRFTYNAVAAFGQVVLKVFGVVEPSPEDTFGVPVGRLEQVWPKRRELIDWPPLITFDRSGYEDLNHFVPLRAV